MVNVRPLAMARKPAPELPENPKTAAEFVAVVCEMSVEAAEAALEQAPAVRARLAGNLARLMLERGVSARDLAVASGVAGRTDAHRASNLRRYVRAEKWPRDHTVEAWLAELAADPSDMFKKI